MRTAARLVALLVLLAGVAPLALAPPIGPDAGTGVAAAQSDGDSAAPDRGTTIRVQLHENASARWTVETYVPLETANETRAFETYERGFENGSASAGYDVDLFRNAADLAADASGRQMSIPEESVSREAVIENGTGVLRLSFVWEGFLEQGDDGTLVLEDAFRTPGNGTWLGSLGPNQRLVVESPRDYDIAFNPGFQRDGSRIIIEGARYQGDRQLRFSYSPGSTPPIPWAWLAGVGVVGVLLVAVGWYVRGRQPTGDPTTGSEPGATTPPSGDDGDRPPGASALEGTDETRDRPSGTGTTRADIDATTEPGTVPGSDGRDGQPVTGPAVGNGTRADAETGGESDSEPVSGPGRSGTATDADGESGGDPGPPQAPGTAPGDGRPGRASGSDDEPGPDSGSGGETDGDADSEPDLELLSDEERVEYLLESNGGRMKQANIVSETGWSDAKVSQLLSSMADEGRVNKLRLGRENLISLPDEDEPGQ
jgi:hypothetical protein